MSEESRLWQEYKELQLKALRTENPKDIEAADKAHAAFKKVFCGGKT